MSSLSENRDIKILHVGNLSFPMNWKEWYSVVEKAFQRKIILEEQETIGGIQGALDEYDLIKLSSRFFYEASLLFSAVPPLLSLIQSVDLVFKKDHQLWPHLIFKEGLHSSILMRHPSLNIKGGGLIIGGSSEALQSAFVLAELGLSQITLVVEDEKQGESIKKLLTQALFQIQIEIITREKVILLPGVYSVLVCCEDLKNKQDLLTSILYFNYLEKTGLVVNAGASLEKLPLVEEAQAIGATVIDITELQIHREVRSLQKIMTISNKDANQLIHALLTRVR